MKQTLKSNMRQGKVAFEISWTAEMPFDLEKPENAAFKTMFKAAFETAKTTLAGKAKKAYALALNKKPADFSTDDMDDPIEAEKHWQAVCKGSDYSVSGFKDYVPQADGQIAVTKVLAWLASLPPDMTVKDLLANNEEEAMSAAELKEAIIAAN